METYCLTPINFAMNNLKQIERLRKLHQLIKHEKTGTPKELARKFHVSERQVYLILDQLREMEAPVRYNRRINSYYYEGPFDLSVSISVKVMQGDKLLHIYAGSSLVHFIRKLQGECSNPNYLSFIKSNFDFAS